VRWLFLLLSAANYQRGIVSQPQKTGAPANFEPARTAGPLAVAGCFSLFQLI
jgi:hypothetical protein